ncbi:hypothetical protein LguiB_032340 [Lonicera macranthoides]
MNRTHEDALTREGFNESMKDLNQFEGDEFLRPIWRGEGFYLRLKRDYCDLESGESLKEGFVRLRRECVD